MSLKSKNLEFEATQPAFLQRLRGQARGDVDTEGRHFDASSSSAGRLAGGRVAKRLEKGDEDEDAPLYVVEGTNETLSKGQYEKLVNGDEAKDEVVKDSTGRMKSHEGVKKMQKVAEIGKASKKRKAVKIGEDDAAEGDDKMQKQSKDGKLNATRKKKAKVKGGGVKLSFDDEG